MQTSKKVCRKDRNTMPKNFLNKRVLFNLMVAGLLSKVATLRLFAQKKFEITPEQYYILSLLVSSGPLYQRQICEQSYKDRPNMTRLINILEKQGLVKRVADINKRKIYKIFMTEKGQEVYSAIKPYMLSLRDEAVKDISVEDIETCIKVLDKMKDNLQSHAKLQI